MNDVAHNPCLALLFLRTVDVFENLVHLFERFACRLGDEEKGEQERETTEDSEESVRAVPSVLDEGRGDEALVYVSATRLRNKLIPTDLR